MQVSLRFTRLISVILITFFVFLSSSQAGNTVSGLTGQYSCLLNRQLVPYASNLTGSSGIGVTIIGNIDYSKNTGAFGVFMADNFGKVGTTGTLYNMTGNFTEVKYTPVPNSYKLIISPNDGSNNMDLIVMPVNGGNSLLVTAGEIGAAKAPWSGVCQKI